MCYIYNIFIKNNYGYYNMFGFRDFFRGFYIYVCLNFDEIIVYMYVFIR